MNAQICLVTGASGYVAGHWIRRLFKKRNKVRSTGQPVQRTGEVRQ